jgi:hypothetical protein
MRKMKKQLRHEEGDIVCTSRIRVDRCIVVVAAFLMVMNTSAVVVTLDQTIGNPSVNLITPTNKSYISGEITIEWEVVLDDTHLESLNLYIDSDVFDVKGESSYLWDTIKAYDGKHVITLVATDSIGNTNTSQIWVIVDNTDPYTRITFPTNGAYINEDWVTVEWVGVDDVSGIKYYCVYFNGEISSATIFMADTYITSMVSDGAYVVYVTAFDNAGNRAGDIVSFTIDTVDPTINITSPVDGTVFNTTSVTIRWNGRDNNSGINHYEIRIDDGNWFDVGKDNHTTFMDLSNGVHSIDVRAFDNAGNSQKSSVSFSVNTTKLVLNILSPSDGVIITSSSITISWIASDITWGIDHYEVRIDTGDYRDIGLNTNFTFDGVSDGSHTVYIKIVDRAGNEKEFFINVKIDTNVFSITGPYKGLPTYLLITLVVVIAMMLILWFMIRKKKGKEKETLPKEEIDY